MLLVLLAAVFLKGFKEAIGVAVVLVVVYLGLSLVVIGRSALEVVGRARVSSATGPMR